jgi:7,8-dihydro-6-hydroxymethylpterin-pyrophosphokinase
MHKIYLSLGSNIGDTKQNSGRHWKILRIALQSRMSSYYETEPSDITISLVLNLALEGETELAPMICWRSHSPSKREWAG